MGKLTKRAHGCAGRVAVCRGQQVGGLQAHSSGQCAPLFLMRPRSAPGPHGFGGQSAHTPHPPSAYLSVVMPGGYVLAHTLLHMPIALVEVCIACLLRRVLDGGPRRRGQPVLVRPHASHVIRLGQTHAAFTASKCSSSFSSTWRLGRCSAFLRSHHAAWRRHRRRRPGSSPSKSSSPAFSVRPLAASVA